MQLWAMSLALLAALDWASVIKELGNLAGGLSFLGAGIWLIVKATRYYEKHERVATWVEKHAEPVEDLLEKNGCQPHEPGTPKPS